MFPLLQAENAIREGRVSVNGRVVKEPFSPLPEGAHVKVDGKVVSVLAERHVLLFHKMAQVVTSTFDPEGQGTVFEKLLNVLPPELKTFGWHAVGRLDRNTTGLLLFTNDEKLVAHVTHPSTHLPKRYVAKVLGQVTEEKLEPLRTGMTLHDGPTRPAKVKIRSPQTVELTITEGRNHQVKRMLGEVGLPVVQLHREAVGNIEVDVPEGAYRLLSKDEIRDGLLYTP